MQQPLPNGTKLDGKYRIEGVLGRGGFGITYKAIDESLSRPVAIKELFPDGLVRDVSTNRVTLPQAQEAEWTEAEFSKLKAAFVKEGQILASIKHDHIVPVLALFPANDTFYLVMEFIQGKTLLAYSNGRGPLPWAEALSIFLMMAEPVAFLHERKIYHRDLNPKNVILQERSDGSVWPIVIDFGLAREGGTRTQGTKAFVYQGYAPLEQYQAIGKIREFGSYVDVYSLSALLYRLLTCQDPMGANIRVLGGEMPSPVDIVSTLPVWLSHAVMRGMAIKTSERPQTIDELLRYLRPPTSPKRSPTPPSPANPVPGLAPGHRSRQIGLTAPRRTRSLWPLAVAFMLVLIGSSGGVYFQQVWLPKSRLAQAKDKGVAAYRSRRYAEALKLLLPVAEQGDADAQVYVAYIYNSGLEALQRDPRKAVSWFRKAAEAGSTRGMNNLGVMYLYGRGDLPKDDQQAASWFRKAAEAGSARGMNNLGVMYQNGLGVMEDHQQAASWFRKAAEAGSADGMAHLGWMYRYGWSGLPKDDQQAVSWYRKAAEAGSSTGMYYFGWMYEKGRGGLPKDERQAVSWYRKAAEAGSKMAKSKLDQLSQRR